MKTQRSTALLVFVCQILMDVVSATSLHDMVSSVKKLRRRELKQYAASGSDLSSSPSRSLQDEIRNVTINNVTCIFNPDGTVFVLKPNSEGESVEGQDEYGKGGKGGKGKSGDRKLSSASRRQQQLKGGSSTYSRHTATRRASKGGKGYDSTDGSTTDLEDVETNGDMVEVPENSTICDLAEEEEECDLSAFTDETNELNQEDGTEVDWWSFGSTGGSTSPNEIQEILCNETEEAVNHTRRALERPGRNLYIVVQRRQKN